MKFRQGHLLFPYRKAVDAAANTNTTATYFGKAPMAAEVRDVCIIPNAALTAHSDNYATIAVLKGTTEIASMDTSVTDWVAGTAVALTLSTTPANLDLAEDQTLNFTITKSNGTGVAVPISEIQVHALPQRKLS